MPNLELRPIEMSDFVAKLVAYRHRHPQVQEACIDAECALTELFLEADLLINQDEEETR